jgi:glucuronate isomerase
MARLDLDPDRLLPAEPGVRAVARELYASVAALPVVSPHSHVDAAVLVDDEPFADPASLFVVPDHYVTRLLHSRGVALEDLGVPRVDGAAVEDDPRAIWRRLCRHWHALAGTATRVWLEHELVDLFGVSERPAEETADDLYDQIAAQLTTPELRPRRLYDRFGLEVLATTDSPIDELSAHSALRHDPTWPGRVVPTFRPDALMVLDDPAWPDRIATLGELAGCETGSYAGFLAALAQRRADFAELGATSTDHGPGSAAGVELERAEAEGIYARARAGRATPDEVAAFASHMLLEFARMSCEDGLVMQLHPGVWRDHDRARHAAHGTDVGGDIPTAADFVGGLHPLLNRFGSHPRFTLVLFTVDESTWSRELAPLAGYYPSVHLGAPWWFLDTPDALRRFREATTETAGFANTAGFVDDTRAFCSIGARHDVARRVDCGYLARLVAEGRLTDDEALGIAAELAVDNARRVFRFPGPLP